MIYIAVGMWTHAGKISYGRKLKVEFIGPPFLHVPLHVTAGDAALEPSFKNRKACIPSKYLY
jgi:hypothetical protein